MRVTETGATWKGTRYTLKTSFDLYRQIEDKVSFSRIADRMQVRDQAQLVDVPLSHVAWVVYCCLRAAHAPVRTPEEVHTAMLDGTLTDHGDMLGDLIVAYYDAQPAKPTKAVKKKTAPNTTPSPS